MAPIPEGVESRKEEQRQKRCYKQAAHNGDGHRSPEGAPRQRYHRQDCSERSQHYGPGSPYGRLDDRFA